MARSADRGGSTAAASQSRGVLVEDFLQTGFRFDPDQRIFLDSSVLVAGLNASDEWHRVTRWLFIQAILLPQGAPHTMISPEVLQEYGHYGTRGFARGATQVSGARQLEARRIVLSRLEGVIGEYPLIEVVPTSLDELREWRSLYTAVPFGATDALLLAKCKVNQCDFLTVDRRLVEVARQHRRWLERKGYHFTIYYTPDASSALPGE